MQSVSDTLTSHKCPPEIHRLETSLRTAQEHYSLLRTQFQQLREEFRFNLDVLEERDQELHRYELITFGGNSILEQKRPPARHLQEAASEDIHKKMKSQENNSLSLEDDQRPVSVDPEEKLRDMDKAISKMQTAMDTLSAQTMSMKTQHQQQLKQSEDMMDRYKKQLSASLEREKHLEQRLVQMELEWQKNCEGIQSKHYLDVDRLIQELTAAREKTNAELMETKAQLQELTVLLQCVTKERDQALQGRILVNGSLASEELTALQQQNSRLQAVVSEMRKQMEELSCPTPPPQHRPPGNGENKETNVSNKANEQHLGTNIAKVKHKAQKSSCVCSCGCVSINAAVAQLRSRLKRAALRIANLNRDQQHLIELCNRLRAQVCAAQSQSNENTANHSVHPSTHGLESEESGQKRESVGQQLLSTLISPQNCSRLLQAHRRSEESLPSLRALWALLDQGPLPDLSADPAVSSGPPAGGPPIQVSDVGAPVHRKSIVKPPQKRGQVKNSGKFTQTARIRNYNIKD